ncbi:MAG: hypothetical protein ACLP59_29135 [Bryobacteraceae bacterium]
MRHARIPEKYRRPSWSLQRRGYHFFIAREARPPDHFFVLGINISADAQLNHAARHKQEYRCGWAEGLQQR